MALSEQEFRAIKSEAARKAGATKVAGREIKKIIDGSKAVCRQRLINLQVLGGLTQEMEAWWQSISQIAGWPASPVRHPDAEEVNAAVRKFESQLIRKAQAVAPDVQIKRRYGGLVFEAKVTLEGMTQAADSLLGEGWRDELPVRRRRRRRSNDGTQNGGVQ